ncbi:3-deoxy-manno-octulosonate cytidylyltransferase [Novispirillum sp. DQ9]|uniref:3-deoxy-manno-octulosonate cytidylyltransferase n=1 Tax=Novispirillum sp. DQ9 TaxID=3398612 RepID=UPI003C7CE804
MTPSSTHPACPPTNPLIVIPARMASTRLPGKPLADIAGAPMIVQVWRRAMEVAIGPVVVACAEAEIADAVTAAGGAAVLTDPDLPSGSDRVWQAVGRFDAAGRHDVIVNVQGDLPTLDPALIQASLEPFAAGSTADITTLVCEITDPEERTNPNVVKAVVGFRDGARTGRGLYFSRATVPHGDGPLWHHIGLYAYRRSALARFVALPPGVLENREKLEQLRALENGMTIDCVRVDTVPLGVDTPADLEKARRTLSAK